MPAAVRDPASAGISLRALTPRPAEVRLTPSPLVPWRLSGSAQHPLARYLNGLPCPAGDRRAEVVVLGETWSRAATVAVLSAVAGRGPATPGWSRRPGLGPPGQGAPRPAGPGRGAAPRGAAAPGAAPPAGGRRLVLVHSGAGGGSLLRGFAAEQSGLSVHAIEMREPTAAALRTVARLLGQAAPAPDDLVVARDGTVSTAGWEAAALPAVPVRLDGLTVLVTGGLGDLGVRSAARLAQAGAVPVLVDARSPDDAPPGVRRYLAAIRRLAPGARTLRLDLSDAALVTGRLTGLRPHAIVHCAGRIAGGTGRQLGADDIESMVTAKVDTLRHVIGAVCPDELRAVLAFGSVTGYGAHPGLYGYALANELLRREVARLAAAYPVTRWCAAEWSLWSGAGMARSAAPVAARRLGMVPVPVLAGTSTVARLVGALVQPGPSELPRNLVIAGERPGAEGAWAGRPEGLPGIDAALAVPPGTDLGASMRTTAMAAAPGLRLVGDVGPETARPLPVNTVVRAAVHGDLVECVVLRADPIPGAPLRTSIFRIQQSD